MGLLNWITANTNKTNKPKSGKRSYDGAQGGRLYGSWDAQVRSIDADIKAGLRKVRARTRDLAQNNDYVRRYISVVKSNVIGAKGITLQARSVDANDKPDILANKALEEAWKQWGEHSSPDVTGQHSWKSMLGLIIETIIKDGEVLLLKHKNWKGNKSRFALEFVDVESLDVEHCRELKNGNVIKMSVEFNKWRRPVAYHLLTTANTDDDYRFKGRKYTRVTADKVIHLFKPENVWQTRGVPWLASSLLRLKMLDAYEEAELVASKVAASKMGFFTSENGTEYTGEGEDTQGNTVTDAEPGSFEQLSPGTKLETWEPNNPNSSFSGFITTILKGVSAGLGISYHTLANDLADVNYSSARIGALEDRELWKMTQEWLIESFCVPVYREWLETSLLAGSITVNEKPLKSSRLEKFKRVSWQPRRWLSIDPQKDTKANKTAIESRMRSISSVIRENGDDPDDVFEEIASDEARMIKLNIQPQPVSKGENTSDSKDDKN